MLRYLALALLKAWILIFSNQWKELDNPRAGVLREECRCRLVLIWLCWGGEAAVLCLDLTRPFLVSKLGRQQASISGELRWYIRRVRWTVQGTVSITPLLDVKYNQS